MNIINLEQGSEEWLAWRATRRMASEFPVLLGLSLWPPKTPLQLFEIKTGLKTIGAHYTAGNFNLWTIIVVGALLMMFSLTARAGAAELMTFRCSYERYSDGEKIRKVEKPFEWVFVVGPAGKATATGNMGSSEVIVSLDKAGEGVSFVEVTPMGNVMTTVVDSKGTSIHSRHTLMAGQVVPSQYYGRCL